MSVRSWIESHLAGTTTDSDDDYDEFVELVTVVLANGPLLLRGLAEHGIVAHGFNAYSPVTRAMTEMRILVRRTDLITADNALRELGFAH